MHRFFEALTNSEIYPICSLTSSSKLRGSSAQKRTMLQVCAPPFGRNPGNDNSSGRSSVISRFVSSDMRIAITDLSSSRKTFGVFGSPDTRPLRCSKKPTD